MNRFLQTLAIAALMIAAVSMSAFAAEPVCGDVDHPHMDRVVEDIRGWGANEPAWAGLQLEYYVSTEDATLAARALLSLPQISGTEELKKSLGSETETLIVATAPNYPLALLTFFDKKSCFTVFLYIPPKDWEDLRLMISRSKA